MGLKLQPAGGTALAPLVGNFIEKEVRQMRIIRVFLALFPQRDSLYHRSAQTQRAQRVRRVVVRSKAGKHSAPKKGK